VTVTDPAGHWKNFQMDAFGNLVLVSEPDPVLGTVTSQYTYDVLNHLTNVAMTRGTVTQNRIFNYINSSAPNVVTGLLQSATNPENATATNPEGGTVYYTYYPNNLLETKTDNKGQILTYVYDGYNRLQTVTWTNNRAVRKCSAPTITTACLPPWTLLKRSRRTPWGGSRRCNIQTQSAIFPAPTQSS
jgi:YD repeat-containing protein